MPTWSISTLINSKISLLHPKGVLAAAVLPHLQKGEMRFQADHLYWDQIKNTLTLKGHIAIDEASLGTLDAQKTNRKSPRHAIKGKTCSKRSMHKDLYSCLQRCAQRCTKLISSGSIDFDRDKLRATIDSPEKEGAVATRQTAVLRRRRVRRLRGQRLSRIFHCRRCHCNPPR